MEDLVRLAVAERAVVMGPETRRSSGTHLASARRRVSKDTRGVPKKYKIPDGV